MSGTKQPAGFVLCAGHAALDFVNTLDDRFKDCGPTELLRDYTALLRFTVACDLIDPAHACTLAQASSPHAAARALHDARQLREALAKTLYGVLQDRGPAPAEARVLERFFGSADQHRELHWEHIRKGAAPGHWQAHWEWGRFAREADLPVWILARTAAELVASERLDRMRACAVDTCRWLFLDATKNHSRRWCQMQLCGNRMKARRFQARR